MEVLEFKSWHHNIRMGASGYFEMPIASPHLVGFVYILPTTSSSIIKSILCQWLNSLIDSELLKNKEGHNNNIENGQMSDSDWTNLGSTHLA